MVLVDASQPGAVDLAAEIQALKKSLNAVVLAHYYQYGEVQDVADFIGDSLQLAREAAQVKADVIVFCGVHFMAETAKIMSPDKLVLLPDLAAGCSLSESAPAGPFAEFVAAHPDHTVVTYVNSSAAVKALSDYCCTSSNAVDVVNSIPKGKPIIFAPDRFLGDWVMRETGRDMLLWEGSCEVHELFSEDKIVDLKQQHPGAITLVHPECPAPVRALADVIGSTKKLLEAVRAGEPNATYVVVTEPGIIHQMQHAAPQATFIMAPAEIRGNEQGACTSCNECPHMKRNTLEKLYLCMRDQSPSLELPADLIKRARLPIERMLSIG
ncbi:MAG: quinolinate synthase NadA [Planctomycetota bacterium]|jgi:quinolinate synthase|nr:quinolinate synthase NadA [Planctomycetota bacterium]